MKIFTFFCIMSVTILQNTMGALGQQQRPRWVERLFPCSVSCNGGVQRTFYECWIGDRRVGDNECNPYLKPDSDAIPCGQVPCPPRGSKNPSTTPIIPVNAKPKWILGEWGSCSSRCGPGLRRREANCVVDLGPYNVLKVEEKLCSSLVRPQDELGQCSSGVSVPCPPFASQDVLCFSPPCRSTSDDQGQLPDNVDNGGGKGDPAEGLRPTTFAVAVLLLLLYAL